MQTFCPYSDFFKTAQCLDRQRCGKQRVEAFQLTKLMLNPDQKSWRNHPAFKMWDGYDITLIEYGIVICEEWVKRGYKDSLRDKFIEMLNGELPYNNPLKPFWLGQESFHASHRSNLLRKDYEYYSQFGWKESPNLKYVWPVR